MSETPASSAEKDAAYLRASLDYETALQSGDTDALADADRRMREATRRAGKPWDGSWSALLSSPTQQIDPNGEVGNAIWRSAHRNTPSVTDYASRCCERACDCAEPVGDVDLSWMDGIIPEGDDE